LTGTGRGEWQESDQGNKLYAIPATAVVAGFRPSTPKGTEKTKEVPVPIGEILIGDTTALEKAILQSRDNSKKVLLAQATIEGVKVEGIDTNAAVMKVFFHLTGNFLFIPSDYSFNYGRFSFVQTSLEDMTFQL